MMNDNNLEEIKITKLTVKKFSLKKSKFFCIQR